MAAQDKHQILFDGLDISDAVKEYIIQGQLSQKTIKSILGPAPYVFLTSDDEDNKKQFEEKICYLKRAKAIELECKRIVKSYLEKKN